MTLTEALDACPENDLAQSMAVLTPCGDYIAVRSDGNLRVRRVATAEAHGGQTVSRSDGQWLGEDQHAPELRRVLGADWRPA